MIINPDSTLRDVAFAVCSALDGVGITAVLTGGSAATIWVPDSYQSRDCDFVICFHEPEAGGETALTKLGYARSGETYVHTQNTFTVEFPPGPLSVGDELLNHWETLREESGLLHVLTPTDSCRDRLAAFYHWNDFSSLKSAAAIAQKHDVNMDLVRAWSLNEGAESKFEQFLRTVKTL